MIAEQTVYIGPIRLVSQSRGWWTSTIMISGFPCFTSSSAALNKMPTHKQVLGINHIAYLVFVCAGGPSDVRPTTPIRRGRKFQYASIIDFVFP